MDRFVNKVAVVTGSSAGIGAAISKELLKHGIIVAGLARRMNKLQELANEVKDSEQYKGKFHPVKCDITNEDDIKLALKWVFENLGPVHILVNNAGVLSSTYLADITSELIDDSYNTNVKSVLLVSKEVIKNMVENSVEGHIININSVVGQVIPKVEPNLYILYVSTKHALRVISEGLRREMIGKKTNIKVTNLSPGLVATAMTGGLDIPPEMRSSTLQPEDVADALISVLNTAPHVTISELTVQPLNFSA
ncbi:farnesol dehydrogenase-like [Planococcus citri]|uniref:farnesol dehydrogenase-like n=1 Tax=Planococcus citri TaxID=170843 RepID=UPI0031F8622C